MFNLLAMNETSKIKFKYNSFLNNIQNATKKIVNKDRYKTHLKQNSMEIKYEKNKVNLPYKNIHMAKEILISQNAKSDYSSQRNSSSKDIKLRKDTSNNKTLNSSSNNNSILNKNGLICFNNINIFNTNKNGILRNQKTSDINLRQYLLNKVSVEKNSIKPNEIKHTRSTSNYLFN